MIIPEALEAAMLEWYGPSWRDRFFPGRAHVKIPEVMDAMRRSIEAANAVTFRHMRGPSPNPVSEGDGR